MNINALTRKVDKLQLAVKPQAPRNELIIDDTPLSPEEKVSLKTLFAQLHDKYGRHDDGRVLLRKVTDQELLALDLWCHLVLAIEGQNEQETASLRAQLQSIAV